MRPSDTERARRTSEWERMSPAQRDESDRTLALLLREERIEATMCGINSRLSVPFPREFVSTRAGGNCGPVTYASIDTINAIALSVFQNQETVQVVVDPVFVRPGKFRCKVRITLPNGAFKEDYGTAMVRANNPAPDADLNAYKSCVSDATKRAYRKFGPAMDPDSAEWSQAKRQRFMLSTLSKEELAEF